MENQARKPPEIVAEIVERVVERLGLLLDHVDVSTHRKQSFVRVYVDKDGGVSIDDCQKASAEIGTVLDVEDPMPGPYTLEVSSPGLDRPLRGERDYERFTGRRIKIHTYGPVDGTRDHVGELLGLEEGVVRIRAEEIEEKKKGAKKKEREEIREIPLEQVAKAQLEIEL